MKAWALVVLAGCAAAKPERLANVERIEPPVEPSAPTRVLAIAVPRPAIDLSAVLPDPTEQARWPLTSASHPALEPRFAIAAALAEPGIGWAELCRMGVQNRHLSGDRDLQTYLKAWCAEAKGETAEAFAQLASMEHPIVSGMAPAIRLDLADLLVHFGDADHAEHLLAASKIEDIEIFDLLAATYFEIGKSADAYQINERAIDRQTRTSDAAKCHRYTRRIVLERPGMRPLRLKELDDLGNDAVRSSKHLSTDPECRALSREIECWIAPATSCVLYVMDAQLDPGTPMLLDAYYRWPTEPVYSGTWWSIAMSAEAAGTAAGADRLELAALAAAFQGTTCSSTSSLANLHTALKSLRVRAHDPSLDRSLDWLVNRTHDVIEAAQTKSTAVCERLERVPPPR